VWWIGEEADGTVAVGFLGFFWELISVWVFNFVFVLSLDCDSWVWIVKDCLICEGFFLCFGFGLWSIVWFVKEFSFVLWFLGLTDGFPAVTEEVEEGPVEPEGDRQWPKKPVFPMDFQWNRSWFTPVDEAPLHRT
jgi:hypothetical protein